MALFQASFLDATPIYLVGGVAPRRAGCSDRPLHPLLCLNLGLSFSVHDVSEQAIAHLAYIDVRFPEAGYAGDTVRARSTVLGVKPASSGDKGVVHVRTILENERGAVLCAFERKALIRAGKLAERPAWANAAGAATPDVESDSRRCRRRCATGERGGFGPYASDFTVGQVFTHAIGKTIGESEHMQLTALVRNSHPLHFDEVYCKDNSFTKQRVVYGGLVLVVGGDAGVARPRRARACGKPGSTPARIPTASSAATRSTPRRRSSPSTATRSRSASSA